MWAGLEWAGTVTWFKNKEDEDLLFKFPPMPYESLQEYP